ncbi:hypothetical protein GCM10009841_35990 [Microlunatus panaciterrae]|uniref:Uncharacterized protein n=1 Tax=Microlunatus panaciterrae TaxID=400768 RepID=A0ABS2RJY0_9ACTN|nr:hypothetical protein [Microlunatus panaciterrae]MBM7798259.1 hypothetical protein [Microlunatus panaciterrae]
MDMKWIRHADGSLLAQGEFASVAVTPSDGGYLVTSGGADQGAAHATLESAQVAALHWLAVLDHRQ